MANAEVLKRDEAAIHSIFDPKMGANRGQLIEKKIDVLEGFAGRVSNRRSRRWLNDRLLIELVPCLNAEEIRGLFAPPPWGDNTPVSAFCMKNMDSWDPFRNVDMEVEACMIQASEYSGSKSKSLVNADKMEALRAWRRVDCRTREALKRNFLSGLVSGYESCVREYIEGSGERDILVLYVQDPFHRLLLHGVCEFYNLVSVTVPAGEDANPSKMMKIRKKPGSSDMPPDNFARAVLGNGEEWGGVVANPCHVLKHTHTLYSMFCIIIKWVLLA